MVNQSNVKNELKISLIELRKRITLDKKEWENIFNTNCYAYALGLDIAESDICEFAYAPGELSGAPTSVANHYVFKYSDLLESLHSDLEALRITYREVESTEPVSIAEWKIALFTSSAYYSETGDWLRDYHFLRQHTNGIWYHKSGWYNPPINFDNHGRIITNPEDCYLNSRRYRKCLALSLKK